MTDYARNAAIARGEVLFNVDMDGARVATGVTRDAADAIKYAPREVAFRSCYVYLMDRPLAGRKPAWRQARIPRLPSLRVAAETRQKLTDALRADGTLRPDDCAPVAGVAVGAVA